MIDENFFKPQVRELDFTSWRYRLLHWVWNADPDDFYQNDEGFVLRTPGGLPKSLYTHYCPLFHLTHVLIFTIPFVLAWRLAIIAFTLIFKFCEFAIGKLRVYNDIVCDWIKDYLPKPKEAVPLTAEEIAANERIAIMNYVQNLINEYGCTKSQVLDFISTMRSFSDFSIDYNVFAAQYFDTYTEHCKVEKEKYEARLKIMRDRITFFVNVGQVLFKIFQFVFYIGSAIGLSFVLVMYTPSIVNCGVWSLSACWDFVCWLASAAVSYTMFDVLYVILYIITYFLIMATGAIVLFKLLQLKPVKSVVNKTVVVPCKIVEDAICSFCTWVIAGMSIFAQFIARMYENNCPPIKIVKKDK